VDEALRNITAVGGDPAQAAILDNFCWGDPRKPDRMAGLVRAAAGCHDAALAFGAPFISGKDSLNNEYQAADGSRHAIPPTLLISALAIIPEARRAITMDLKEAGNLLYIIGTTGDHFGGAHYPHRRNNNLPRVDLEQAPRVLGALHSAIQAGFVRACHDLSEGGLAVAAAEMALAGRMGAHLDLRTVPHTAAPVTDEIVLFAESPTRLLAEVRPADAAAFEACLAGLPHARIGSVTGAQFLVVAGLSGKTVINLPVEALRETWQSTQVV
jgi:phosphoribosylformylglycinamidine synthase